MSLESVLLPRSWQRSSHTRTSGVTKGLRSLLWLESIKIAKNTVRRTQLGDTQTDLQSAAHSLQEEISAAEKTQCEQAVNKALADARRRQENEDFEGIAGLHPAGRRITTGDVEVEDASSEDEGDDVVVVEDGLDGSGLFGADAQANSIQCPRTSSLGAQPTARGGGVGGRTTKRVLLEQSLADSAANCQG